MELLMRRCPACRSEKIKQHMTYETKQNGQRVLSQGQECEHYFSATKNTFLEGLRTPLSKIWEVLDARTEGLGLNAAARVFKKAKTTILRWERKCAQLHQVLLVYALVHQCLPMEIA